MTTSKPIDLQALEPLKPEDLPVLPLFWQLVIEPMMPPSQSAGGIQYAEQSQEVERIQTTVGRIVAIGALAFKGKTSSGLVLGEDPKAGALKEGDWVLFARYTGQVVKIRRKDRERMIVVMSDTELLGVVSDPHKIRFWL